MKGLSIIVGQGFITDSWHAIGALTPGLACSTLQSMLEENLLGLLEGMSADRLLLFCGAGLSMSAPSSLPSAASVASACCKRYKEATGIELPQEIQDNIEAISRHFHSRDQFPYFVDTLVPWGDFFANPNPGHTAAADFLECNLLQAVVTTNFDMLFEKAAETLGERDFRPIIEITDLPVSTTHRPLLKLHGTQSQKHHTLWCADQLADNGFADRIARFREWLVTRVLGRDILLVGFWTDWAYMTDLLAASITQSLPQRIWLVDLAPLEVLEQKAPRLWEWAHNPQFHFTHLQVSGAEFLDALRTTWGRVFLSNLESGSREAYESLFACAPSLPTDFSSYDSTDIYSLRRDLTGTPRNRPVRERVPAPESHIAAALHARLCFSGATYSRHNHMTSTGRVRVVCGKGRLLSAIKREFSGEPPLIPEPDIVVCAGASVDPTPADLIRATEPATIVRGARTSTWVTHDQLVDRLRSESSNG